MSRVDDDFLKLVPTEARNILVLGCGTGALGQAIKARQSCRLTGVDRNPQALREAQPYFDEVIEADLNGPVSLPEAAFDAVIFEHLLEGLKNPWALLAAVHGWLQPAGVLVCAVHNIANFEIMDQLAAGHWDYSRSGALDRSHLRFFTRKEFLLALQQSGFAASTMLAVMGDAFSGTPFPEGQAAIQLDSKRLLLRNVAANGFHELTAARFLITARKTPAAEPARHDRQPGQRLVSVILAFHDQPALTQACLEMLAKNTSGDLFELILVNNASTQTPAWLQSLEGDVRVVTLDARQGAGPAWNAGARLSSSKYLVFLHNDAFVQPGWLNALVAMAEQDGGIMALSPRVVGANGRLQSAGGMVFSDGERWDFGRGDDPNLARFGLPCDVDVFSSACCLVRRDSFEQWGGFDPQFSPAYYEDADLCFGLRRLGGRVAYCPGAWAIHLEGQTTRALLETCPDIVTRQREKFAAKWKESLAGQGPSPESAAALPSSAACGPRPTWGITRPAAKAKLSSLVVLAHNQCDYTRFCLESILAHTHQPYELIVVDNASSDNTRELLQGFAPRFVQAPDCRRFDVIRSDRNLGFAGGNNQGMAHAAGDYVLLLNNDLVLTPGWLERLTAALERSPRAGIVGPMTNYASGPQWVQEPDYNTVTLAGLNAYALRVACDQANRALRSWRIVGFCLGIRQAVVQKIGGLDTRFGKGNFEDDDYCLRSLLAGFESYIVQDCFVHHFGSRTFAGAHIDYQKSLLTNWEIFKAKWSIPQEIPYGGYFNFDQIVNAGFKPAYVCPLKPDGKLASKRSGG